MQLDIAFRTPTSSKDITQLIDFIHNQSLDYPHYDDWVERTESQLKQGTKQALLAFNSSKLVGNLVFQDFKSLYQFPLLELKNLRIHPQARELYLASSMIKHTEKYAIKNNYHGIICDAREERLDVISYMNSRGYRQVARVPLYERDRQEVVLFKSLGNRLVLPEVKKLF